MRIEYHRTLLADRVRNTAFHAALERVIVKGETTVADIGAGTGFLGFLAAKLGAKRVDLYEATGVAGVARKLLRRNRLGNCRIFEMYSTEAIEPDRVDVIVCETLGNYPLEENIVETLNDARERFLNPGGTIIPAAVRQFVCPVVTPRFFAELAAWDQVGYGLDFAPAKSMTLNNIYVRTFAAGDLLQNGRAATMWDRLLFQQHNKTTRAGAATWALDRRTTAHGLALWWTADLADGIALSTGPLDPRTHWEQLYLPVLEPLVVEAGQTLTARVRSTTSHARGTNVAWTLAVNDAAGREVRRQSLDLERGFLP
ncbi:MAG TPA: 50S ribosomal protein L11 methyltransferase [Hyphomicrobiaceae bacterium]|jgi:protein arginine N-methyltransferase 1|nr:50S ribosomal protein L11 methyltransferase [Hyphomicrobiaceae bacterium]